MELVRGERMSSLNRGDDDHGTRLISDYHKDMPSAEVRWLKTDTSCGRGPRSLARSQSCCIMVCSTLIAFVVVLLFVLIFRLGTGYFIHYIWIHRSLGQKLSNQCKV